MRKLLYCIFIVLPFLCSCIGDDCSTCVEMAYETRVTLKISNTSSLTKSTSPELDINNIAFFVFNADGSLNTVKKFTVSMPSSSSQNFSLNISSDAKSIYAIANCSDILTPNPTSLIASQINSSADIYSLFSKLAVNHNEIVDGQNLILVGSTNSIALIGSNPYQYQASITMKPIVSKFSITAETSGTPSDFATSIYYIKTFVLNARDSASLFDTNLIDFKYMHGFYQSFWNGTDFSAESISPIINSNLYSQTFSINNSSPIVFYIPQNDTTIGSGYKTIAVLEVGYKMISIDGTEERFKRFFSVSLNPPINSKLSVSRGKNYNITFKLSGRYFGALSPLSSMMAPFSPIPQKNTKGLEYVTQDKYSSINVSNWQ